MKQIFFLAAVAAAAIALIPLERTQTENEAAQAAPMTLYIEEAEEPVQQSWIRLLHDGEVSLCPEEEYLAAVVLCEMPPDFESEALKAQAVAARTFACRQARHGKHENADVCADPGCCQAWMSRQALQEKYADRFESVWQKALSAVQQTAGEVLVYDGELIDATYFSCSGGSTESAAAVWGSDVPYLQAVASPAEQDAPRFCSQITLSAEAFRKTLEDAGTSLTGKPESWIGAVSYTAGGGVDTMQIGADAYSGTDIRKLFGLNSTAFTVSLSEDGFTFDVRGFGHRVGMSQYGANNMAKQGFGYRSILLYYYQGVKIEKSLSQS